MRDTDPVAEITPERRRKILPKPLQVAIFRRDGWLCCWCKRPVIFSPAMRLLEAELRQNGHSEPLAYYHRNGRRDRSPLLDELAASIDHVEAFVVGGLCEEENLRTSCWKCNSRKNAAPMAEWNRRPKHKPIKGKYGEPQHWDGLSSTFVMLAERNPQALTPGERDWLRALKLVDQPSDRSA